jgi:site-specific recombinase XerD
MQTYGKQAGLPPEKRKFHSLKHSIATHLLDARGELKFLTFPFFIRTGHPCG